MRIKVITCGEGFYSFKAPNSSYLAILGWKLWELLPASLNWQSTHIRLAGVYGISTKPLRPLSFRRGVS
jgi:hypothetical protein